MNKHLTPINRLSLWITTSMRGFFTHSSATWLHFQLFKLLLAFLPTIPYIQGFYTKPPSNTLSFSIDLT